MQVKFCAIDPSISCTGVAILEYVGGNDFILIDKASLFANKTKYREKWQKKLDMLALFEFYMKDKMEDISFFVFENYSYGSVGQLADLGELGGLLKKHISDFDKSFDVMAPSSVKKIVTGNGRASKDLVQESLVKFIRDFEHYNWNNFDESDAVAVGVAYALKMQESVGESKKD